MLVNLYKTDIKQKKFEKLILNICNCKSNFSSTVSGTELGDWITQLVSQWGQKYPISDTVGAGLRNEYQPIATWLHNLQKFFEPM